MREAGIAQLVERPTEKPGAIQTRVRIPGTTRDFSPRASFQCRLSYGVRTVSVRCPCAVPYINICVHIKNPKHWPPYHGLDKRKYCTRWQKRVALLLQLLCITRVRRPKFPPMDNEVLKQINITFKPRNHNVKTTWAQPHVS